MIIHSTKKDPALLDIYLELYYETGNIDFLNLYSKGWTHVHDEERAEELRAMIYHKKN